MKGPQPSSDAAVKRLKAQRTRDTKPEVRLRQALHARGLRFRVHRRPIDRLRRTIDVVFGPSKVAVAVHGCYWHGCEVHGTVPKANRDWWEAKLAANRRRDRETEDAYEAEGWAFVTVWEHDDPEVAADRIATLVESRRPPNRSPRRGDGPVPQDV